MMKNKTLEKSTKMGVRANGSANGTHEIEVTLGEVRQGTFTQGQIEPIEIDDADLVLMDDADRGEIPPKASFPVQLHITKVERGQIEPIEIDDAGFLWNALDSRAIGKNKPLETQEIEVTIGEVRQGKPRAVAMDELDWEFLDFD